MRMCAHVSERECVYMCVCMHVCLCGILYARMLMTLLCACIMCMIYILWVDPEVRGVCEHVG